MRNRGFSNQRGSAPVNVGDELDVKIEGVGEKGDGIAKKEGFVLFVPNGKEGQNLRIRVTKVLKNVGFADIVGKAEGPVASEEAPQDEGPEEMPQDEPEQQVEPSAEDSEDFGEEDSSEDEETKEE